MKHTLFDERRKLRTRKFFGIPVPVLAMLIIAGVVAAAYMSKQINSSAPQTIQGTALSFKAGADPGATPSVPLNTLQGTTIDVQGGGGDLSPPKMQNLVRSKHPFAQRRPVAAEMDQ